MPSSVPSKTGNNPMADAFGYMQKYLEQFGLGSLADRLWAYMIKIGVDDANQLYLWIQEQPEFKVRFPAIEARRKKGMAPISPEEYVDYEQSAYELMRASGMPEGFYDGRDDFAQFLINDVSINELNDRIQKGWTRVANAPFEVRNAFMSYFGVDGDAALAAYFLDPNRALPLLEKRATQAEIAGSFSQLGFGSLNQLLAEELSDVGVDVQSALQGFSQLAAMEHLFNETVEEAGSHMERYAGIEGRAPTWATDAVSRYEKQKSEWEKLIEDHYNYWGKYQTPEAFLAELKRTGEWDKQPLRPDFAYDSLDQLVGEVQDSQAGDLRAEVEGVRAVFGTDPDAMDAVERRRQERVAKFKGGGGAAVADQGAYGIGTADN